LGFEFEPCLACGINHLTGSVASLVAPTTTATTSHFSMWPLKDICLFVPQPASQSLGLSVCLPVGRSVGFGFLHSMNDEAQPLQIEIEISCQRSRDSSSSSSRLEEQLHHPQQHPHHGSGAWLKPALRKCPG